jgi:F0F1-type ATP synthase assembly protein I
MGKAAANRKTTTTARGGLEEALDESAKSMARNRLMTSLLGTSWQLLTALGLPLLLGIWVDSRLSTKPAYSLMGFVLGVIASSYVIYREFHLIQSEQDSKHNSQKGHA